MPEQLSFYGEMLKSSQYNQTRTIKTISDIPSDFRKCVRLISFQYKILMTQNMIYFLNFQSVKSK